MTNRDQDDMMRESTEKPECEAGQGLAEYALILAFVAIAAVAALSTLGVAIRDSVGFKLFT